MTNATAERTMATTEATSNLKLARKVLFESFEIECYEDVSRDNGDFFMTRKQIAEALNWNVDSLHKTIVRNRTTLGNVLVEKIKAKQINNVSKSYKKELYTVEQIIVILSFTSQPKTSDFINALSRLKNYNTIKIKSRYETDFDKIIFKTFENVLDIKRQYSVGTYFIDWYIDKYNIVIECDENNHEGYDGFLQDIRKYVINENLNNPNWIRFNPNEPSFNIGNVLNQIIKLTFSK